MKKLLLLLLGGLVCLSYTPVTMGNCMGFTPKAAEAEVDLGTHELSGPVRVLWATRWDGWLAANWPNSIAVSPSGDTVYVVGPSPPSSSIWDPGPLLALDATTGNEVWWKGVMIGDSFVTTSPDGTTLLTAGGDVWWNSLYGPLSPSPIVDFQGWSAATGDQLWRTSFKGYWSESWSASLAVSPDGMTVFFTHWEGSSGGGTSAHEVSTGFAIWEADGGGSSIAVSPDGASVFVTGESTVDAYDAALGDVIWTADGGGTEIVVHPGGSKVFVAGESGIFALDSTTGQRTWVSPFKFRGDDEDSLSLAVSADGGTLFVSGETGIVAYDCETGDELRVVRFDAGPDRVKAAASASSPDGKFVFVTGVVRGLEGGEDYITVAYDVTTGAEIWTARYDGTASGLDQAMELVVSPDGSTLYVTGESEGIETSYDIVTIAYELKRRPPQRPADE